MIEIKKSISALIAEKIKKIIQKITKNIKNIAKTIDERIIYLV